MDLIIYRKLSRGGIEPHVIESLKAWPFGEEQEDGKRAIDEGGRSVSLA